MFKKNSTLIYSIAILITFCSHQVITTTLVYGQWTGASLICPTNQFINVVSAIYEIYEG